MPASGWPELRRAASSSSGRSPSPSTTRSKGPSSNINSGRNVASMPPATMSALGATRRTMCASSRSNLSVMPVVETPTTSHAPCEQFALERPLRRLAAAIRIEDLRLDARRFEHPRQPPHTQGGSEERVFAAVRIVWTDQQYPWRACIFQVTVSPAQQVEWKHLLNGITLQLDNRLYRLPAFI